MRSIDPIIKNRLLQMQQTLYSNAQPAMDVYAIRPRTPIFHKRFWQESVVAPNTNATSTSVALQKTGNKPERVYVAYISNSTLIVKSAVLVFPVMNMDWQTEQTIADCSACALVFDGSFVRVSYNKVEFRTDHIPWLFYVTSEGQLMAGLLGGSYESLSGTNVTSIDAIRGVASLYKDIDQGLVVFYIISGAIYYNQLIGGVWHGQESVNIAPANAVRVHAERTFDWRIVLQVTDTSGVLYEVFAKMEASGWNGTEYISIALSADYALSEIFYKDYKVDEFISLSFLSAAETLYANSPVIVFAENIDNGSGNYGFKMLVTFDERVFGEDTNQFTFKITDEYDGAWGSAAVTKIGLKQLEVIFEDFNNAAPTSTLSYVPGTLMGDVVAVNASSIQFEPVNLVPTELPQPVALSAENIDETRIVIAFDIAVKSADWNIAKAGFTITSQEYNRVPDGELEAETYTVESAYYNYPESPVPVDLSTGTLTDLEVV